MRIAAHDICDAVAKTLDMEPKIGRLFFARFIEEVHAAFRNGAEEVAMKGLGTIEAVPQPPRDITMPSGAVFQRPATKRVRFKPSALLEQAVKGQGVPGGGEGGLRSEGSVPGPARGVA